MEMEMEMEMEALKKKKLLQKCRHIYVYMRVCVFAEIAERNPRTGPRPNPQG
jgi:hypothetical protein